MSNREKLLLSHEAGCFLETVNECSVTNYADHGVIIEDLVALHNEGLIDVVGAFESVKEKATPEFDFFRIRHIFEKALPHLNAPVRSVMQCVMRLYLDAGKDMAAGMIFESYMEYCKKNPARCREALVEIEKNPNDFKYLIPVTLVAGSQSDISYFQNQVIRLCEDPNIELRRQAVFSIGQLIWPEGAKETESAFITLEKIVSENVDDQILANALKSVFSLFKQHKAQEQRIVCLVGQILPKGNDFSLHAASEIFGVQTDALSIALMDVLIVHLARVKAANSGTINFIDYGLSHMVKKGDSCKAIQFLTGILLKNSEELTMKAFTSTARELLSRKTLLSTILTQWFLRGDRVLCDGVFTIISDGHDKESPVEIDPSVLMLTNPLHVVFIARKTIGYLFTLPVCAASVLIALMRTTDDDAVQLELGALLFDPLLLNYTGKAREYVESQSEQETGKTKATIKEALKAIDCYLVDLHSVGNLPALRPCATHREAQSRHFARLMAESMKAAEAQSVFLKMFSKSILLYGRKSISYVNGAEGKSQRMEIPLQCHGTEIEFPRMQYLDPFGMDYGLRILKCERLKS